MPVEVRYYESGNRIIQVYWPGYTTILQYFECSLFTLAFLPLPSEAFPVLGAGLGFSRKCLKGLFPVALVAFPFSLVSDATEADDLELESVNPIIFSEDGRVVEASGPARMRYGVWQLEAGRVRAALEEGTVEAMEGVELRKRDVLDWEVEEEVTGVLADLVELLQEAPALLRAEALRLDRKEGRAAPEGMVDLTVPDFRLLAEDLVFDQGMDRINFGEVRIGGKNFRILAVSGTAVEGRIVLEGARVFPGEPDPYALSIEARQLEIGEDNRAVAHGVVLKIGPIPYFYWPRLAFQLTRSANRFRGEVGYNRTFGLYGRFLPRIALSPRTEFRPNMDLYTERGPLLAPGFTLDLQDQPETVRGKMEVETGGILDQGDPENDFFGNPINRERGWAQISGWMLQEEGFSVSGNLSWWSDAEVLRDFRPAWSDRYQDPVSFLEARGYGLNWEVEAFGRFRPNPFQTVVQKHPALRLRLLPVRLGESEAVLQASGGWDWIRPGGGSLSGEPEVHRLDQYTGVTLPLEAAAPVRLVPAAGLRSTLWDPAEGVSGGTGRVLGEVGMDARLPLLGHWDLRSETWRVFGLRHRLEPVLGYRWIGEVEAPSSPPPALEREAIVAGMEPLSLGARRDLEEIQTGHTFRMGTDNRLQTRSESGGTRDLLRLRLFQDITLDREDGDVPQATRIAGDWLPAHWLTVHHYVDWDTRAMEYRLANAMVSLNDSDVWVLGLGVESLRGEIAEWLAEFEYALTERSRLLLDSRWDGREGRFTRQRAGYRFRLGNSWDITAAVIFRRQDPRQDDFQFNLSASSLMF